MDIGRIPIIRIFFNNENVIRSVTFYLKRPARHNMFRTRPGVAPLLDRRMRYDAEKLVAQQTKEERSRLVQFYPKRVIVNGLDTDVFSLYWDKLLALQCGL